MLVKLALVECEELTLQDNVVSGSIGMIRTASGRVLIEPNSEKAKIIQAEISKHPNALFFRAKAIEANRPNSNGDYFSEEELLKAYKSFEGVPFFTNHDNQNIENARGKIIFAEWIPEEKACYTVAFVDRDAYPHICRSIEEEYVNGVSMGFLGMEAEITMSDLSTKKISEVIIGDVVLTPYGNNCAVEKIYSDIVGKPMYEIDAGTYHKSPLLSDDHPVYVIGGAAINEQRRSSIAKAQKNMYLIRKGKTDKENFVGQDMWRSFRYTPEFKETKDIKKGDYVLIPSKYKIVESEDFDPDFYYLAGAYVGDGYIGLNKNKENYSLAYYIGLNEKKELGERICNLLPKYSSSNISQTPFPLKNGLKISICDKKVSETLFNKFGKLAHEKRIYQKEFTAKQICSFISGYIDTDGTISKTYNKKQNGEIRGNGTRGALISSCNKGLLEDVQSLLILLDVSSYITWNYRKPNKNSLVKVPTLDYSLFIPYGKLSLFLESIKVKKALSGKSEPEINAGQTFIFENDGQKYMACPVKSVIEHEYNKPCYDLKVKGDESYIADGMAVHNCSVEYSVCNICGNKAEKTDDYCSHIKNRKGRKFSGRARNVITGETKDFRDEPVFEYNYGLKFIELSAVVDPACPTCRIQGIIPNSEYLKRVANMENSLFMVKTAALEKQASKEEIDQIEGVLTTLEEIAVNLIKNRKQVEMEFASDLVEILSKLQTWLDELIGAGYGNLKPGVPGSEDAPSTEAPTAETPAQAPAETPQLPPSTGTGVVGAVPAASESAVGKVSGAPGKPAVSGPRLPINAPLKPRAEISQDSRTIQRLSDYRVETGKQVLVKAASLCEKMNKSGDTDMAKRRTIIEKMGQKEKAKEVLSNSWKEKQDFFEYINKVPSLQDNENRLSVKKSDDSFIIVAEKKVASSNGDIQKWTFEDLTEEQKKLIKDSPKQAAVTLLETFAKSLKTKKEGVEKMTDINKNAGLTTINAVPEVVQEAQLESLRKKQDLDQITQAQLDAKRKNNEPEVVTEAQLKDSGLKLNPRTGVEAEEVQEAQLKPLRDNKDLDQITQAQLEAQRVGNEPDQITERQLDNTAAPWARSANRNAAQFKSAKQHIDAVVSVMANSVITAGCTPEEVCEVSATLVGTTKDRYDLATSILETEKASGDVDFAKRASFWNNKSLKIASTDKKQIAQIIVDGLRKIASDVTINPEVLISAVDVIGEGGESVSAVAAKVDEKLEAASKEQKATSNIKAELRAALKVTSSSTVDTDKLLRDEDRKNLVASVDSEKAMMQREAERTDLESKILNKKVLENSDAVVDTTFEEIGCKKDSPAFKSTIASFARGALASQNIKMAAITNVTISGDTIQIAVQTDEGSEEVEIPVGDESAPAPEETMPEGDLSGEGLENTLGTPPAAPAPAAPTATASSKKMMVKKAQAPMGGGVPGTPGGVSAPGGNQALPGGEPGGDAVQALTGNEEGTEDVPTIGEQQMPWSICPECGGSDVDVTSDNGDIKGKCNNPECEAEYDALLKRTVEYTITKPSKAMNGEGTAETPESPEETPEVPALPVAAQTRLDKKTIMRIASNKKKFGNVCPACGKTACKATKDEDGHTEFHCPACSTDVEKDVIVSASSPDIAFLRVKWDTRPIAKKDCKDCDDKVARFASRIKVEKLIKSAADNGNKFPMENCIERVARQYGGNVVGSFGPCKGKVLAECVCKQLKSLALTKVRHLQKFAEASMQEDPLDQCLEDQKKKGSDIKEATAICDCLKKNAVKKIAGMQHADNIYIHAFADDIKNGIEKSLTVKDLENIYDMEQEVVASSQAKQMKFAMDEEIGDDLSPLAEAEVEVEMVKEVKPEAKVEAPKVEAKTEVTEVKTAGTKGSCKECGKPNFLCKCKKDGGDKPEKGSNPEKPEKCTCGKDDCAKCTQDKKEAMAMNSQRVRKTSEEVLKMASKPTKIEHIEQDVEAGVPRKEAYMGKEQQADSMINKTPAKPNVPRSEAYMGKEKEADSMINAPLNLPDVPVDSSYMGQEQKVQSGMPAINNEIKGTIIASDEKVTKEAKKMKEVDTVEKDVEAGVPRSDAKMGEEAKADSLINTKNKGPDVPRSESYMGKEKEADSLINAKLDGPDVPIDSSYMGKEKEAQKGMPAINDEMLKNVKAQRDEQIGRLVVARERQAERVVAWLVANKRVPNDQETFNYAVKALSSFEIEKIPTVADKMFPERTARVTTASATEAKTVEAGYAGPAIVMESKATDSGSDFQKRLANAFTIGNKSFDEKLTIYGEKQ